MSDDVNKRSRFSRQKPKEIQVTFRLLTYKTKSGRSAAGLLVGDTVIDIAAASAGGKLPVLASGRSTLEIVKSWEAALPELERLAADAEAAKAHGVALSSVKVEAPIIPEVIYCTAANYSDHVKEMQDRAVDKTKFSTYFFLKGPPSRVVVGPGEAFPLPTEHSKTVDWEAELAVVIGKPARNVSLDEAMNHVAGYTIVNDLSARDHLHREDWPFKTDWFGQKVFDASAPMGPYITPRDDVKDLYDLPIRLWVNGELRQDTSTRYMIFNVAEQIVSLSRQLTLQPGDIISTGTGSGVGTVTKSYLKSGDNIRIEIGNLGVLENSIL